MGRVDRAEKKAYQDQWEKTSQKSYRNSLSTQAKVKRRRRTAHYRMRGLLRKIKAASVCQECGESHDACLVFHHEDPSKKDMDVCVLASYTSSESRLRAEIAKCICLCANCHRKLHWRIRHDDE